MSKRLSPAQKRVLRLARGMAALGLPMSQVPAGCERGFLAKNLLDCDGVRTVTVMALIRKGYLEAMGIAHIHGETDVILRIRNEGEKDAPPD